MRFSASLPPPMMTVRRTRRPAAVKRSIHRASGTRTAAITTEAETSQSAPVSGEKARMSRRYAAPMVAQKMTTVLRAILRICWVGERRAWIE